MTTRLMSVSDALDTLTSASEENPVPGEDELVRQAAIVLARGLPPVTPLTIRVAALRAGMTGTAYKDRLLAALDVAEFRFHHMLASDPAWAS